MDQRLHTQFWIYMPASRDWSSTSLEFNFENGGFRNGLIISCTILAENKFVSFPP